MRRDNVRVVSRFMEKRSYALTYTRNILPAVLGALASVLLVALATWAASTVGNNINTGGTLTVSGESTLSATTTATAMYASSTVFTDGIFTNTRNAVLGTASQTPAVTGLNLTGDAYITSGLGVGYATTSDGNLLVTELASFNSRVGVSGTSSPTLDFGVDGSGLVSGGLGVGYATTSGLYVSDLGVFRNRLGVNATNSPTVEFGVTGSGLFSSGLGVGYATTGSGDLLVSGLAVVQNTGRLGVGTTSPVVLFGVGGDGYLTGGLGVGTATTSAGGLQTTGMAVVGGGFEVRGATSTFLGRATGFVGSTTPYLEVGIAGDAAIGGALGTSTLSLESSTSDRGGCIELRGSNGRWVSMYVGSVASTSGNVQPLSVSGQALILQTGRCQTGNE